MAKRKKKRLDKIGRPPGSIEFSGEKHLDQVHCRVIEYDNENLREDTATERFGELPPSNFNQWFDIVGLHETELIKKVGKRFKLHPLTMEDILSTSQRPKVEVYEDYIYMVLRMILVNPMTHQVSSEQVSLVLGQGWLLSFQEKKGDVFEIIRDRLRNGGGRVRKKGVDYLAYSLVDAIVDQYFVVLEDFADQVEDIEEGLLLGDASEKLGSLQEMKRFIIGLRKSVWPLREAIHGLTKMESSLVEEETQVYLRDAYDHTIQVVDTIESLRDMVAGVQDLYLSVVNNKMNEVMKVLALISTIFLPLTLVAGIYGMNFQWMPELSYTWGYPLALTLMFAVGIGMYLFFKSRKWI